MMPNANLALATPAPEENWGPPVINNLIANTFDEGMQTVLRKFSTKMVCDIHNAQNVCMCMVCCPLEEHVVWP